MTSNTRLACVIGVLLVMLAGLLFMALAPAGQDTPPNVLTAGGPLELLVLGGGAFLLIAMVLLNAWSLARTGRITHGLREARERGDWSRRLDVTGRDETAELAAELNQLLALLDRFHAQAAAAAAPVPGPPQSAGQGTEIFQASLVGHCICTLHDARFVEANDSFLTLLGRTRAEVVGRTDEDLALWSEPNARAAWWQLVREKHSVRDVECTWQTAAGEARLVAASAHVAVFGGEECVVWTGYDLTEQSHRELHARQAQKLEAITKLAAGFAHDFNNLLCVVQGHTSLLLADRNLEPTAAGSLKQIAIATERGANLTRQLLTFSRKQVIKAKTLDANLVIHGMSNMLVRVLGDQIALRFECSGDVPLVQADTGLLEQVIMNLLMNARDAMPKGGQVTINTSAFAVDDQYARLKPEAYAGQFACVSVTDTGCGLEPGAVNRIFEPFFTTKDVGKGSGLGLATVYGIVKQHKGWIEVASQLGQGTTFKVFLPATEVPVETAPAKVASFTALGGKERIFLVEDEPGLLALAQRILEGYGYEVVTATNGVHALQVWEAIGGRVDLMVTDVVMPEGLNGCELAARLRARQPQLKIIFTSGYSADLVGATGEELVEGFNFVQKPYRPQVLAQAVRQRLNSEAAPAENKSAEKAA